MGVENRHHTNKHDMKMKNKENLSSLAPKCCEINKDERKISLNK